MNFFLEQSIAYAAERAYLDDLFKIYPTGHNGIREINKAIWKEVESAYISNDDRSLITNLLRLDLFPLKNSYVAYLKRDKHALERNPKTLRRLAAEIREMNLNELYDKCSQPKESNRQIGPMFKNWIRKGTLGFPVLNLETFRRRKNDAILDATDKEMQQFAQERLGYNHPKGLDFIARVSGKYVIGEAKFLTDFGGHQNAQFNDAIATLESPAQAEKIAILDGVLYIPGNNKMYTDITTRYSETSIMSALMLRNYLNTI